MTVRRTKKNGREYWLAEVYLEGKRYRRFRLSEEEARRAEWEIEEGLHLGPEPSTKEVKQHHDNTSERALTLEQFAPRFLSLHARINNKPSEYDTKVSKLNCHLIPFFGRMPLADISSGVIAEFTAQKLGDGLAPKTVNNLLTALRCLLARAVDWGDLDAVPKVRWVRAEDPEFDFLDFEEAERLWNTATEPTWGPMIRIAIRTGLRQGELRALKWDDVDLVRGVVHVRRSAYRMQVGTPKTKSSRRDVPLSPQALAELKEHRHLRGEFVFCNEDGSMLRKEQGKRQLWHACKRAGLRRVRWHVLRHTFASHLVMRGRSLKEVQELMGHTTIKMTMRYAHLSPEVRREAVNSLDGPATATTSATKEGAK